MKHSIIFSASLILMTAVFTSCNNRPSAPTANKSSNGEGEATKIAYVDVDTLMKQYQYCLDYTKLLKRKSETIQSTLSSKSLALQKQVAEFQSKMQQGGYTREQAESMQTSLQKRQLQLQNLQQSLSNEFEKEQSGYNEALRDSLRSFLKAYNKTYNYTFIISKAGDNILLANEKFDITEDVIKGLNKRYKPGKEVTDK